jgi:chlorosome envelope protein B
MSNETSNDLSAALSNIVNTGGALVQQSLELVSNGVKGAVQIIEPLGKTAIDLLGSAINTIGSAVQNVTSAITPKK